MKKIISFLVAIIILAAPVFAAFDSLYHEYDGAVFSDVSASDWFAPYVNYAYKNGLMNGVSATRFDPEGDMNRAMIVTVLWRTEGTPAPSGPSPFDDLREEWYRGAVVWAAENGIVNGTGKGKFSPDDPLTREQIAAIMMRFSTYKGYGVSARADISTFPDASKVDGYAVDSMRWAVGSGLITGSAQNGKIYLDPLGHATRAQVATILNRYLESEKDGSTVTVDRGGRVPRLPRKRRIFRRGPPRFPISRSAFSAKRASPAKTCSSLRSPFIPRSR